MRVSIDLAADVAKMQWAPRARGRSQVVNVEGRGVRLLQNEQGDVVGVEILGWSARADVIASVEVAVSGLEQAEVLDDESPLGRQMLATDLSTDEEGRPLHDGLPMLSLSDAARILELDRSWVSREASKGRLESLRVGTQAWTTERWVAAYKAYRLQKAKTNGGRPTAQKQRSLR
jgi:hypothetical protein